MFNDTTVNIGLTYATYLYDGFTNNKHSIIQFFKEQFNLRPNTSKGVYRQAIITSDVVFKAPLWNDLDDMRRLREEYTFIEKNRMHPKFGRHFPASLLIDFGTVAVLVQERVNTNHGANRKFYNEVGKLANKLNISDFHDGNFGWKTDKNGLDYPVFIDVDFRDPDEWDRFEVPFNYRVPKVRRDWFV